jgi:hypothetical protein
MGRSCEEAVARDLIGGHAPGVKRDFSGASISSTVPFPLPHSCLFPPKTEKTTNLASLLFKTQTEKRILNFQAEKTASFSHFDAQFVLRNIKIPLENEQFCQMEGSPAWKKLKNCGLQCSVIWKNTK